MLRDLIKTIIILSFLLAGCRSGQLANQGDSPEGGITAPTFEAVQVIPNVTDSEAEQFAIAIVNAEKEGVEPENIEGMESFLEEVDLSTERYIQIRRGIKLDANIENSIQEKIDEIRKEREEG